MASNEKLLPFVPTEEMVEAGIFAANGHPAKEECRDFYRLVYEGMYRAANGSGGIAGKSAAATAE